MLPIINILLIVGILLFILYNLYVDTRNWSNTGSFLEGMENGSSNYEYAQKRYCSKLTIVIQGILFQYQLMTAVKKNAMQMV